MEIQFTKYHGTGNDFILIDNRQGIYDNLNDEDRAMMCHRRFGIGADGLMYLQNEPGYDFKMRYFNADGREATMCGNGGRCIVQFAIDNGVIKGSAKFLAIDGPHKAIKLEDGNIRLQMQDIANIKDQGYYYLLDTGSPHYVCFVENLDSVDVHKTGREIRYSDMFAPEGLNVNFIGEKNGQFFIRTYERGVEAETYSCGTGTVAAAITCFASGKITKPEISFNTRGGMLRVDFLPKDNSYQHVFLSGPAVKSFSGRISL